MGCPAKVIVNQGAGCAMIREPIVALSVIKATIEGADGKIPVSVKTRTGFSSDSESTEWLSMLLDSGIAGLSLHARTRRDMSKVPARWENLINLRMLRDQINPTVKILGNGDITSLEDAYSRIAETGVDGAMVGRGLFGNPWFFNQDVKKENLPTGEVLEILRDHISLFEEYLGDTKSFSIMKKHFKSYLRDTELDKHTKHNFLETNSSTEAIELINCLLRTYA
jgi:tRNA-dihydrouridine synthase